MPRILLVDDEQDLLWAVRYSLADAGYEVFTACDGREALAAAQRNRPDLIVLDVVMPKLDGLQLCHKLRRDPELAAVPILFLSVRSDVEDRIKGLDRGADDYLVKPFDMEELKARIRALLRRHRYSSNQEGTRNRRRDSRIVVNPLALDLQTCQVHVEEESIQLTPTQFELLRYLMVHPGEVFSSRQLLEQVWGYAPTTADPSLVRWHIKNLREKIESDPTHPDYIRTIPGHGYMLERRQTSPTPQSKQARQLGGNPTND